MDPKTCETCLDYLPCLCNARKYTCRKCGKHTQHRHLHDKPPPSGKHIAGSERFECSNCQHTTRSGDIPAPGMVFKFDV